MQVNALDNTSVYQFTFGSTKTEHLVHKTGLLQGLSEEGEGIWPACQML